MFTFVTIVLSVLILTSCEKVYNDMDDYEYYVDSIPGAGEYMPTLDDLPTYSESTVFFVESSGKSLNLIIKYSMDDYEDAKNNFLSAYEFLKEPLVGNDYYIIPEVEVTYNDYVIKVVDDDNFEYPEAFGLLGYSDVNYTISFMFFYDESLNSLGNSYSMQDFIEDSFKFPSN